MATQGAVKEKTKTKVKEPKRYNVVMLNDDFTTMEFVVEVLMDIFGKNEAEAEQIMLFVHKNGRAVVGCYPYDIANTKARKAMERAKANGFPFRVVVEEA